MATQTGQTTSNEQSSRKRTRISLDMTPELRRRVKIEAAKRDVTVRAYLEEIIERAVMSDERAFESARAGAVVALLRLRDELATAYPDISHEDSTELLREVRDERTQQLDQQ